MGAYGNRPLLGQGSRGSGLHSALSQTAGADRGVAWDGRGPTIVEGAQGWPPSKGTSGAAKGGGKGPGAHVGAGGGGAKGDGKGATGQGGGKWTRPARVLDDDDYELVQPRRVRVADAGGKGDGDMGQRRGQAGASGVNSGRRWSDEDSDEEVEADGDEADEGDEVEDQARVADDGDPARLRATFEEHARAVREMERKGGFGPALATMRNARDAAEAAWRQTKAPAPLPKRLQWAEAKLHKAQAALTRERLALDAFDEETERRRDQHCARIREAEEWLRWRQQQLDDIHSEVGERAPNRGNGRSSEAGAKVRQRLRGQVLPEIQAILEKMQDGTDIHERLTLVAAGLADAERQLDDDGCDDGVQHFDMHDGDDHWDGDCDHDDALSDVGDEDERTHERGGDADGGKGGRSAEWRPEGPGRWTRAGATSAAAAAKSDTCTSDANGTRIEAGGALARARASDSAVEDLGEEDAQPAERSAKHRRCRSDAEVRQEEDARRARELHQQHQQAEAAQRESFEAGKGGFGSDVALSLAAQKFVLEVQEARTKAMAKGIDPHVNGKDLIQLTPAELQAWVQEKLGDAGP